MAGSKSHKGTTALKKIIAKAKKIHKKPGHSTWKADVKKASAQYREGKL